MSSARISPFSKLERKSAIPDGLFAWEGAFRLVAPVPKTRNLRPLSFRKASVLGVLLSHCPPCRNKLYPKYLRLFLVSVVSICWRDTSELGYLLESQRQIVHFLKRCQYPFHTALLVAEALKKIKAKHKFELRNEFAVLANWMDEEIVSIVDKCQGIEESIALFFEQTKVTDEIRDATQVDLNDANEAFQTTSCYLAVKTKAQHVIVHKWFQGINTKEIWLYEWWDPSSYPDEFDCSRMLWIPKFFSYILLYVLLLPLWCLAPFSRRLSSWRRANFPYESTYFKFWFHNFINICFVSMLFISSQIERGVFGTRDQVMRGEVTRQTNALTSWELSIYILTWGQAVNEVLAAYRHPKEYFTYVSNCIDLVYLGCLVTSMFLRLVPVLLPLNDGTDHEYYSGVLTYSEVFLSIGSLFVTLRLTQVFRYFRSTGPLLQSIINMFGDIALFLAILIMILVSFWMGLFVLFRRYFGIDDFTWKGTTDIMKDTFFMVFTGDPVEVGEGSEFVTSAKVGNSTVAMSSGEHYVFSIYIFTFLIVVVILIVNLLIAMMSTTYENTREDTVRVYLNGQMDMIQDYSDIPPDPAPFSLFIAPFQLTSRLLNYILYGKAHKGPLPIGPKLGEESSEILQKVSSKTFQKLQQERSKVPIAANSSPVLRVQPTVRVGLRDSRQEESDFRLSENVLNYETDKSLMNARLRELRIKDAYMRNNSYRKFRSIVMKRYFAAVYEDLKMNEADINKFLVPADPYDFDGTEPEKKEPKQRGVSEMIPEEKESSSAVTSGIASSSPNLPKMHRRRLGRYSSSNSTSSNPDNGGRSSNIANGRRKSRATSGLSKYNNTHNDSSFAFSKAQREINKFNGAWIQRRTTNESSLGGGADSPVEVMSMNSPFASEPRLPPILSDFHRNDSNKSVMELYFESRKKKTT